jgi:hypothetical protein
MSELSRRWQELRRRWQELRRCQSEEEHVRVKKILDGRVKMVEFRTIKLELNKTVELRTSKIELR